MHYVPPRSLFVHKLGIRLIREQTCQCTSRRYANFGHVRIKSGRIIALILDTTLRSTQAWSGDEDLCAPILHLEKHVFALDVIVVCIARRAAPVQGQPGPVVKLLK